MYLTGDKFFFNNTFRFIYPILRLQEGYFNNMQELYIQGAFIDDLMANRTDDEDYLHVVINKRLTYKYNKHLMETVTCMEKYDWFAKYYPLASDDHHIVLMIRIPEKYQGCIDEFFRGNVSYFSPSDIDQCFKASDKRSEYYFQYCRNLMEAQRRVKINLDAEVLNF